MSWTCIQKMDKIVLDGMATSVWQNFRHIKSNNDRATCKIKKETFSALLL